MVKSFDKEKETLAFFFRRLVEELFAHWAMWGQHTHILTYTGRVNCAVGMPQKSTRIKLKKINTGILNTNKRKQDAC